jgi:diguanylate cyclase
MESFKLKKTAQYNGLFKSFVITFFIITALVAASLILYYQKKTNDYIQYLKITEEQTLKLEKSIILQKINSSDTPVFDKHNKKQGFKITGDLAADIISTINHYTSMSLGETMLISTDGSWLLDTWENKHNRKFIYKHKKNSKFANKYPTVWKKIIKNDSINIITDRGMFVSTTIPLYHSDKEIDSLLNTVTNINIQNKTISDSREPFWKLISFIPKKNFIFDANKALSAYLFWLTRILIILSIIPALLIAYAVTKKKNKQKLLYKLANFDKLTNIPNRKLFFESLQQAIKQATKRKTIFAVLYIDIDDFKQINDTLGHEQGDFLLQEAAERFTHSVRSSDLVARIGGDEFVIILYNVQTAYNTKTVAGKIIKNFSDPFLLEDKEFQVSVSIGITLFSRTDNNGNILLKQADKAMYKAKHSGKNTFKVFNETK